MTESLSNQEIADLVTLAEETFGVYPGNVEADVQYDISGTIAVTTDKSDYSEEELITSLQEAIASALNVHTSDVVVTFDPDSGLTTYTISSETAEDASALQIALKTDEVNDAIATGVSTQVPAVTDVNQSFQKYR